MSIFEHTNDIHRLDQLPVEDPLEYHRNRYDVPAFVGVRVTMGSKPGVITGADGPRVLVLFDGEDFPKPCHPTWAMDYLIPQAARHAARRAAYHTSDDDDGGILEALLERVRWSKAERKTLENLGPPTDAKVGARTLLAGVLDIACLSIPYAILYFNPPEELYLVALIALLALAMGAGVAYSWLLHYRVYRLKRVNAALRWLSRRLS